MIRNAINKTIGYFFVLFFLVLVFFSFFFNPKFSIIGFGAFLPSVMLIIILGLIGLAKLDKMPAMLVATGLPLYIAFILAAITFVTSPTDADFFLASVFLLMAVIESFSFSFFNLFAKIKRQPLLVAVIAAFTLNAILMIVMFASSNFQFWYLNLLSNEGLAVFGGVDEALDSLYRLRMIGANGFASYSAGFAQAIALFFLAVYYKINNKQLDWSFLTISILLIVSALLSARSALLGITLWLVFCLIFFRSRFFYIFSFASFIVAIALAFLVTLMDLNEAEYFTTWIFDLFISGSSSESLSESIQMLDVPFVDAGLFGFSRWYGDLGYDYFRSADVGYIRVILAGGFVSLFFVLIHFLLLGFVFFQKGNTIFFRTLYCFLMVYFLAIMFKGAILFDFFAFDFLMLMLAWIANQNKSIVKIT